MQTLALTDASRYIAGIVLLTVVTIEFGGYFMTRIARGAVPMTAFQQSFARAGHGHAGVLVVFSLVGLLLADAAGLDGFWGWLGRLAIPVAAVVMPAGFFASSGGREVNGPNRAILVVWVGALILAVGVVTLGIGLLAA